MAKDKGAKPAKDKSTKAPKGGNDDFAKPFKLEDVANVGELFIITPLREDVVKTEKYGDADVVVCDVVQINEKKPEKSEEHTNVYAFGGWVRGGLRGYIGERKVLARLGQDASKSKSDKPAWVLEDADADDVELAKRYLASVDPFASKKSKK